MTLRPLEEITVEHFHKMFNLNLLGLILASQEAVKHMGSDGRQHHQHQLGRHVDPPPNTAVYTATKGGVDAVTRTLAKELGPRKSGSTRSFPG